MRCALWGGLMEFIRLLWLSIKIQKLFELRQLCFSKRQNWYCGFEWDVSYPADSTATVLSVVGAQDLKIDVGVRAIIIKLQQAGQTIYSSLQKTRWCINQMLKFDMCLTWLPTNENHVDKNV